MRHIILFVIVLEIALICTDNLNKIPKGRPIPNLMKKLKQKVKNIKTLNEAEVRNLDELNVTDTSSSIYDTSENPIPESIIPTVPTIPNSTTNSTEREESPIYIPMAPIEPGPPETTLPVVSSDSNNKNLELRGLVVLKTKKLKMLRNF